MPKNRRKRLIVNRMQYRLIWYISLLVIATSLILITTVFLLFGREIFYPPKCLFVQFSILFILALVLYIINIRCAMQITNKIYGPLFRLTNYMRKLVNGEETEKLNFRKGDAIDGITEIYNELIKSLEKTLHYDYKELGKTFSELQDILDKIHNHSIGEEELYNSLQNICNRLAKALDITSEVIEKK